ncbi:MAG: phosphatidate cytidylyltransferase [Chlamydiales bacterium]|nr:phosphatidate cytidylyltransferase [Chlamydiales bacterium]
MTTQQANKESLKTRFVIGGSSFVLAFFSVYFSTVLWVNIFVFAILLALTAVALYEFSYLISQGKQMATSKLPSLAALSFLLIDYGASVLAYDRAFSLFILFIFAILAPAIFRNKQKEVLDGISTGILGFIYILIPMFYLSHFLQHAYLFPHSSMNIWTLFLVFVTKASDVGGLLIGKAFGKRPLAPKISPTKTQEGLFGGILFSVGLSIVFYTFFPSLFFSKFEAVILAIILALLGQWGDLVESMFKREANIKHSNSLPGLGGVLDVLDSLTFSSPFLFEYLRLCHA